MQSIALLGSSPRGGESGRAGEIRTRGLLVPNQALCRAKLPPELSQPRRLGQQPSGTRGQPDYDRLVQPDASARGIASVWYKNGREWGVSRTGARARLKPAA